MSIRGTVLTLKNKKMVFTRATVTVNKNASILNNSRTHVWRTLYDGFLRAGWSRVVIPFAGRKTMGHLRRSSTCLLFGRFWNHSVSMQCARVILAVRPAYIVNQCKNISYVVFHTLINLAKDIHHYAVTVYWLFINTVLQYSAYIWNILVHIV